MPIGIGTGAILGLAREARSPGGEARPLRLYGPRVAELRRALARDGDASLALLGGDARDASAIVCTVDGEPGREELAALRTADLRGTPTVAVRLDGTERPVPYVLATDVVAWPGTSPSPAERVAQRLAVRLRREGRLLAARLPVLRPPVETVLVEDASVRGAVLVAAPWIEEAALPVLSVMQTRMLLELEVAEGHDAPSAPDEVALSVGPRLGLAAVVGLSARAVFRRLPPELRHVAGPALAYAGTRALGALAPRLPLPR